MPASPPAGAETLRLARAVRWAGTVAIASAAFMTALSFGLSVFFPIEGRQAATVRLLASWIDALPLPSGGKARLASYTAGQSALANADLRLVAYHLPILVMTGVALLIVVLIARADRIDRRVTRSLTRIAVACGIFHAASLPIFTRDLWLSVGWGQMALHGLNPYDVPMSPLVRERLPFADRVVDRTPVVSGTRMTYGPLWELVAIAIAKVGGSSTFLAFVASKAVLLASWLTVLLVSRRIAARSSERDAAIVTVLLGVLPLLPVQSLAEGHNDIAMVALIVLWFWWATRDDLLGTLTPGALTAGVLVKYVAAPLGILDLIAGVRLRPATWIAQVGVVAVCVTFVAIVFSPFYTGPAMFDQVASMRHWSFFSPAEAVGEAVRLVTGTAISTGPVSYAFLAAGVLIAAATAWRFSRRPTVSELCLAVLAFLWVIAFTVVGHVWPWFLTWPLPFAALLWHRLAGKAYLLIAALTPLLNLAWFRARDGELWIPGAGLIFFTACAVGCGVLVVKASIAGHREHRPA